MKTEWVVGLVLFFLLIVIVGDALMDIKDTLKSINDTLRKK